MRDEEMVLKVSAKPGGTSLLELKSEFCGSGGLSNEQKEDLIENFLYTKDMKKIS